MVLRAWQEEVGDVLHGMPGSSRGYHVLSAVAHGGPQRQKALAERLAIDRTVLVYLIDDLVEAASSKGGSTRRIGVRAGSSPPSADGGSWPKRKPASRPRKSASSTESRPPTRRPSTGSRRARRRRSGRRHPERTRASPLDRCSTHRPDAAARHRTSTGWSIRSGEDGAGRPLSPSARRLPPDPPPMPP
ncbi:hypothetical protein ACFQX6_14900 [Streptosporangium lutulentum]